MLDKMLPRQVGYRQRVNEPRTARPEDIMLIPTGLGIREINEPNCISEPGFYAHQAAALS